MRPVLFWSWLSALILALSLWFGGGGFMVGLFAVQLALLCKIFRQ